MIVFYAEFVSPRDEREDFIVNRKNIISLSTSLYDRGDFKLPSFGIIANKGEVEFNDYDGLVLSLIQSGVMNYSRVWSCNIYIENTLIKNSARRIGAFDAVAWDYDDENKTVKVELKDDLEEWQNITVGEIPYNARNPQEQTLKWFYDKLYAITDKHYNMQPFEALTEKTKEVLNKTVIKYPLLYSGSLWASWQKVCEVGQLHIYKDNGTVKCRFNGSN